MVLVLVLVKSVGRHDKEFKVNTDVDGLIIVTVVDRERVRVEMSVPMVVVVVE